MSTQSVPFTEADVLAEIREIKAVVATIVTAVDALQARMESMAALKPKETDIQPSSSRLAATKASDVRRAVATEPGAARSTRPAPSPSHAVNAAVNECDATSWASHSRFTIGL
jgi:hypothetical protein